MALVCKIQDPLYKIKSVAGDHLAVAGARNHDPPVGLPHRELPESVESICAIQVCILWACTCNHSKSY